MWVVGYGLWGARRRGARRRALGVVMEGPWWLVIIVTVLTSGVATALVQGLLNRPQVRAAARKTQEEAESEDVRQRSTEIENLRQVVAVWQDNHGRVVKQVDELRKELAGVRLELEAVVAHADQVEKSAQTAIANLRLALESEKSRSRGQATRLVEAVERMAALEAENLELHANCARMTGQIEALEATISGLLTEGVRKDEKIAALEADLARERTQRRNERNVLNGQIEVLRRELKAQGGIPSET